MSHLFRLDDGEPIRAAMREAGLSGPKLAAATRRVDPDGRGLSPAAVGRITGRGARALNRCRIRSARLIADALEADIRALFAFSMPPDSTSIVERSSPVPTKTERIAALPDGLAPLLTQVQLETYYGVSDWTVLQWIKAGLPIEPMTTSGTERRSRRFDLAAVKRWHAERELAVSA